MGRCHWFWLKQFFKKGKRLCAASLAREAVKITLVRKVTAGITMSLWFEVIEEWVQKMSDKIEELSAEKEELQHIILTSRMNRRNEK